MIALIPQEHLSLKVRSPDGGELFFRMRKQTPFIKLMDAYCSRQNVEKQNVRFLLDGEILHETQTPEDSQAQDGDEIDAVTEQTGGNQFF